MGINVVDKGKTSEEKCSRNSVVCNSSIDLSLSKLV